MTNNKKPTQQQRKAAAAERRKSRFTEASVIPSGEKLAKEEVEKESFPKEQQADRKEISRQNDGKDWDPLFFVIIIAVISLIIGVPSLPWSSHTKLSLWATVLALLGLDAVSYYALTHKVWRASRRLIKRLCLFTGVVILCIGFGGQVWIPTSLAPPLVEIPLRGLLLPANDPSPAEGIPPNSVVVEIGSARVATEGHSVSIIRIAGEDLLSFERTTDGMYLNAIVRNERDEEVARITKNVIRVKPESGYYADRPDQHTLVVIGPDDKKVLYVRYKNPSSMKVLGVFKRKGRPPFVIEEGKDVPGVMFHDMTIIMMGGGRVVDLP